MPTTATTVVATSLCTPTPTAGRHVIAVAETHDAVRQLDDPSRDDGVASRWLKWRPLMVTLQPADGTKLLAAVKLTTGASKKVSIIKTYTIGEKAVRHQISRKTIYSQN